jgi:glycine/D-amino acid oxidase-like deaminating enzyme
MDLKSGEIYWRAVDRDLACDVAIIGAGITGALVADRLSRDGQDVVVLDRRAVCSGSTPASTGLLQYEIDTPLTTLSTLIGPGRAQRAYLRSYASLGEFERLVATLDDDCGLTARPSLYLAREPDDAAEFRAERDARAAIGIECEYLSRAEMRSAYGIDRPAGLRSARAMEIDPYRLALSLLRRAITGNGARAFAITEVERYEPDDAGVTLVTQRGPRIRTARVVFGTGYETPSFLDQRICTLKSTYAMASEPLEQFGAWSDRCLIWESGQPYFYCRTSRDGRVIVGGEDDDFSDPRSRDARIDAKCRTLAAKFGRLFPSIGPLAPAFRWAGTFAETTDGLPYIGSTPQFPRGLFALGYGGNGITFSLVASSIIADLVDGRSNPDAELFGFGR